MSGTADHPEDLASAEVRALNTALASLEQAEGWEDAYNAFCALSNRVDTLQTYIEVLCGMTKVRPDKLDDLLRIARAHTEFEKILRGESSSVTDRQK